MVVGTEDHFSSIADPMESDLETIPKTPQNGVAERMNRII